MRVRDAFLVIGCYVEPIEVLKRMRLKLSYY